MIAGVTICKNEVDIVGLSLRHHFLEGVDRIYIADAHSTDGTRDVFNDIIAEGRDLVVIDDDEPFVHQDTLTNSLIERAGADGADWILPTDCDEFYYSVNGESIATVLKDCPHEALCARSWQHRDYNVRQASPKRLPKVVFKYSPTARVSWGNHEVSIPGGGVYGILDLREIQFQSFEHFSRKVRERNAVVSPEDRAKGYGIHHAVLDGASDEQMHTVWDAMWVDVVSDPIPTHLAHQ